MSVSLLLDEHVPRLLETTLSSNGYETTRADERFGQRTDDEALLEWCHDTDHVFLTNDRTDFARLGQRISHSGIVIYVDQLWARDDPSEVVAVVDLVCTVRSTLPRNSRTRSSGSATGAIACDRLPSRRVLERETAD